MRQFRDFFMHYVSIVSHPATIENLWETRLFLVFNYLNLDHAIALHHHQLLSNNLQLAKKIEKWASFFSFSKWWMKSCYVTVTGFSNETINCRFWCENNDLFENWLEKKIWVLLHNFREQCCKRIPKDVLKLVQNDITDKISHLRFIFSARSVQCTGHHSKLHIHQFYAHAPWILRVHPS